MCTFLCDYDNKVYTTTSILDTIYQSLQAFRLPLLGPQLPEGRGEKCDVTDLKMGGTGHMISGQM